MRQRMNLSARTTAQHFCNARLPAPPTILSCIGQHERCIRRSASARSAHTFHSMPAGLGSCACVLKAVFGPAMGSCPAAPAVGAPAHMCLYGIADTRTPRRGHPATTFVMAKRNGQAKLTNKSVYSRLASCHQRVLQRNHECNIAGTSNSAPARATR
jgi:hypothetical protein